MRMTIVLASLGLIACQSADSSPTDEPDGAFDAIAPAETVYMTGTEPFWGGEISADEANYTTPENQDGTRFAVSRFAGNNGMGVTGEIEGRSFDLTVTPGACSDGMSDRTYPYTATLRLGDDTRFGCAWTERQPFDGPQNP